MEIFLQLLDELDDMVCATALIWHRVGRAALQLGSAIALILLAGQLTFGSNAWLLLPVAAGSVCIAVWSVAALAQLLAQPDEYSRFA